MTTKNDPETAILSIRMTKTMVDRLDALTDTIGMADDTQAILPGRLTRAAVIRQALAIGVGQMEKMTHPLLMRLSARNAVMNDISGSSTDQPRKVNVQIQRSDNQPRKVNVQIQRDGE
ncbi:MAG: hypothetical protein HQL90_07310 [Magnetococcales bacterium]|nr:hypothetical protein [Magnetococcales bacterium]